MNPKVPDRVIVVGLGETGMSAALTLLDLHASVRVLDEHDAEDLQERARNLRDRGADVRLGVSSYDDWDWAELVVASPGVPPSSPLIEGPLSRGTRVVSELELGWILTDPASRFVAVTGTNGKTTTTTLVADILAEGYPGGSVAAGNVRVPLTEAVRTSKPGVFATEVTSFQLKFIDSFRPDVAVLLNVAEDHYDWHAGRKDYLSSKARITENQTRDDLFLFNANDPACVAIAASSKATLAGFGLGSALEVRNQASVGTARPLEWIGALEAGWLVVLNRDGTRPVISVEDIRLRGRHNLENVLAASIAALRLGVDLKLVTRTIQEFEGLPHRVSFVAEKRGVAYLDDSKATNVHATLQAMDGLENVVLIAGGRSKDADLSALVEVRDQLRAVVVMGEAAAELEKIFSGLPIHRVADVEEAVLAAESMASRGDTVLLSPACSSLDQYGGYEERGERYQQAVNRL